MIDPTKLRALADRMDSEWGHLIGAPDAFVDQVIDALREAAKDREPIEYPGGRRRFADIRIDPSPGTSIRGVCEFAAEVAARTGREVKFKFNDKRLSVGPGDDGRAAFEAYQGPEALRDEHNSWEHAI